MLREALEHDPLVAGMQIDDAGWERLELLVDLVRRYGRAMNLTGASTDAALVDQVHDGLATVQCAREASRRAAPGPWLDVGSGGGFPGLVVAAVVPAPLVLVEPRAKRAAFLDLATRALGRGDAVVSRARIERATWNENGLCGEIEAENGGYRIVSARAVWGPAEWLEMGMNLVSEGGHVLVHVVEGAKVSIGEVPEAEVPSRKGRVLGFCASPERRQRFAWNSK